MSDFTKDLTITRIGKKRWCVSRTFKYYIGYEGSNNVIIVPKGFITDGASIPRIFWTIVGHPFSEFAQAAVLHDFLYDRRIYTRKRSDEIFYEAMGVLKVSKWKRMVMYQAVRRFGWMPWLHHIKAQLKKRSEK